MFGKREKTLYFAIICVLCIHDKHIFYGNISI